MNQAICSTGGLVVRANGLDYTRLKEYLPRIEHDGVEFMLYGIWYDQLPELTDFLRSLQVGFPSLHAEKSIGECITREDLAEAKRRFLINCRLAQDLGSRHMVIHLWNGPLSDSNMQANFSYCGELLRMAKDHGLTLSVENVVCNVSDPMTHLFELLERYPDILFTFDTKMAHFHRQQEALYLDSAAPLIPHIHHLHINDIRCAYMDWANLKTLHIGDGDVDFDTFFAFMKKHGYQGDYVVEALTVAPDGTLLSDKMNRSLNYIRSRIRE